jgi:glycerophosphoryl diester phosphodiesterase
MATILIRHLCSWSLALPLILFSDISPGQCFDKSEHLSLGNKQLLLMTLASWALGGILLSTIVLGGIQIIGSIFAPYFFNSITLLVPVLGGLVALWALGNLLVTTFTSSSFAALLILFYDRAQCEITPGLFTDTLPGNKKKITAPLFTFLLLTTVGIAILTGAWLLNGIPADNDTMIIAHRGAAGKAPENTKVSMHHAINDGTDWIEIDVQETIDGKVVVIHDSDFMKLANNNLKVWEGTLKEIQEIDIGSWFNSGFSAQRVPTLEDILAIAKGKCRVLIELKYYGHDIILEQRVAEIVEQADMVDDVAIMSLKYKGIQNFRRIRPDWPVGLLSSKAIGKISDLNVDFLAINMATAKPSFIRRIQSSGKKVYVWTVNGQVSMSRLMSLGVDGIITDEPALANEVRTKNKSLTPVERLLLHTTVLFKTPIPQQLYRDQSP